MGEVARGRPARGALWERTYRAMKAVVEAPGYPLLTSYKDDLHKHDKALLERACMEGTRWIWVVRESGTHLSRLGVHPKMAEEIKAVLDLRGGPVDLFLVENGKVSKIDEKRARAELSKFEWEVGGGVVHKDGKPVAGVSVSTERRGGNLCADVDFLSADGKIPRKAADVSALIQIAECESIRAWQSLFAGLGRCSMEGRDLHTELEKARERERGQSLGMAA